MTIRQAAGLAPMQASIRLGSEPESKSLEDQVADLRQQVAALTQAMAKVQSELANPPKPIYSVQTDQYGYPLSTTTTVSAYMREYIAQQQAAAKMAAAYSWEKMCDDIAFHGAAVRKGSADDFWLSTDVSNGK